MSDYAFMSAAKYEQIKSELALGVRASVDGDQYVAKLQPDQRPEGTEIKSHSEALTITQSSEWIDPHNNDDS